MSGLIRAHRQQLGSVWRKLNPGQQARPAIPNAPTGDAQCECQGMAYVVIDGTLIPVDRIAADRPFCSGKHKIRGVNLQVIASPD